MACGGGGDNFHKKSQIFVQDCFPFSPFFTFIFSSRFYCFIDLKRQSEHSGLRLDTSSFVRFLVN